jgi:hypothetical protein
MSRHVDVDREFAKWAAMACHMYSCVAIVPRARASTEKRMKPRIAAGAGEAKSDAAHNGQNRIGTTVTCELDRVAATMWTRALNALCCHFESA